MTTRCAQLILTVINDDRVCKKFRPVRLESMTGTITPMTCTSAFVTRMFLWWNHRVILICVLRFTGGDFYFLPLTYLSWFFERIRVSSPKIIWVFRILEHFMILLLDYFLDTISYVGFPEAWLEWHSNFLTQTKHECIQRESNQVRNGGQHKNADDDDGTHVR